MIAEVSVAQLGWRPAGIVLEAVVRREMAKQGSKTHRPPSEPPALVILEPGPRTVIFGNLADTGKVLAALKVVV